MPWWHGATDIVSFHTLSSSNILTYCAATVVEYWKVYDTWQAAVANEARPDHDFDMEKALRVREKITQRLAELFAELRRSGIVPPGYQPQLPFASSVGGRPHGEGMSKVCRPPGADEGCAGVGGRRRDSEDEDEELARREARVKRLRRRVELMEEEKMLRSRLAELGPGAKEEEREGEAAAEQEAATEQTAADKEQKVQGEERQRAEREREKETAAEQAAAMKEKERRDRDETLRKSVEKGKGKAEQAYVKDRKEGDGGVSGLN